MTAASYTPHRYSPHQPEVECIDDAIRLWRQLVESPNEPDVNSRVIVSYCEGVANALACIATIGPADAALWSDLAACHPDHRSSRFALKRLWFDYIRTAALDDAVHA